MIHSQDFYSRAPPSRTLFKVKLIFLLSVLILARLKNHEIPRKCKSYIFNRNLYMNGRYTASLIELTKGGRLAANIKRFAGFCRVLATREEWRRCGNRRLKCFQSFSSSPNTTGCFHNSMETRKEHFISLVGLFFHTGLLRYVNAWPRRNIKHQMFSSRLIFVFSH